jgi:hypothetical protein
VLAQITTLITDTCYIKSEIDNNYYTKTATDALLLPITNDVDNLLSDIHRTAGNWTGGLVIEYPQIGGLGVVNHLDETVALYDVNDISFYKNVKCFAGAQIDTLSGGCLTQIDTLISGKENLLSSSNTINVNVDRGLCYLEQNTYDGTECGVTLRVSINPVLSQLFAVKSLSHNRRLIMGPTLTSTGHNPFYCGFTNNAGNEL